MTGLHMRAIAAGFAVILSTISASRAAERPVAEWTQIDDEAAERIVVVQQQNTGKVTNFSVGGEALELALSDANKLRALPPSEQAANARWIYEHRNELPGAYLLDVARVKFQSDPAGAMELYFLAQVRMRYDALRCSDKTAAQGLQFANGIAGTELNAYLREHPSERLAALDAAQRRDDLFDGKASPWWICSHGIMTMVHATSGGGVIAKSAWLKGEEEWASQKKVLLDGMAKAVNQPTGQ